MTVLSGIPAERIRSRARGMDPAQTTLRVIIAVCFGVGWLAYWVAAGLWVAATFAAAAVIEGFQQARKTHRTRQPRREPGRMP